MRRFAVCVTALAITVHAAAAWADDEVDAREAMLRGKVALERGDSEAALSEFESAKRLAPAANAPWFFAADALSRLGRWREAVQNLEAYLAKDPTVSDAPRVKERIVKIRAEHFPARVEVVANGPDVTVSVDGDPKGPVGVLELAPGRHHIEARAPAYEPASKDLDLTGDTDQAVTFTLRPLPAARSEDPPVPGALPAPLPWRTLGWITLGVGGAGLITTWVVDVAVLGPKRHDYEDAATRGDIAARGLRADAQDLQRGVVVGYVASGAVALAGLAVAVFAPTSTRKVGVIPVISPHVAAVSTTYEF